MNARASRWLDWRPRFESLALRVSRGLLLAILAWSVPAGAQEPVGPARWISDRALLYAEIRDPVTVIDRWESAEVQAVLKDVPGLGEALKRPQVNQARTALGLLSLSLGTTQARAVRDLTAGGIVLAVEGENAPDQVALFVKPRDRSLLERANARIVGLAGGDVRKPGRTGNTNIETYQDVTIYQLNDQEAHALIDDVLVISNRPEFLRRIIDRARGIEPLEPISGDPAWTVARAAREPETNAWGFARLDRLRTLNKALRAETPNTGLMILFGSWYEALQESAWAAAGLTWSAERMAADVVLPTPPSGFSPALARFRPGAGQGALPLIEPPGTILSVSLWRDLSALWEVRAEVLPPEALQGLAQLDSFAGQFFGGRDFGSGVLGALRGDWRLVIANRTGPIEGPEPLFKFPGFALLVATDPDDTDFQVRLRAAFQSFVGLANIGAAQQKAPPLMLGSETLDGVTLLTTSYVPPPAPEPGQPADLVDVRYNFTPCAAQVGPTFVLSSNLDLARSLVRSLGASTPQASTESTLVAEASGQALTELLLANRGTLATRNMLERGSDRASAGAQVEAIGRVIQYLNHARLTATDTPEGSRFHLEFQPRRLPTTTTTEAGAASNP